MGAEIVKNIRAIRRCCISSPERAIEKCKFRR